MLGKVNLPLDRCIEDFEELGMKLLTPLEGESTQLLSSLAFAFQYRRLFKNVMRDTFLQYRHADDASGNAFFNDDGQERCRT